VLLSDAGHDIDASHESPTVWCCSPMLAMMLMPAMKALLSGATL